ncbi:MAG: response regulator [Pseudomonadota bacterium]
MTDEDPHILVIDDDQRLRGLLRKYLSDSGFMVSSASDAADARAKLEALTFDLIVMDVMMPGESGLHLTESLRKTLKTPILLLTAMGEVDDRIAGLESGADDYLPKPFEPRELVLRINSILRRIPTEKPDTGPLQLGPYQFDPARTELTRDGQLVHLTSAEVSLLSVLAAHPNETLSRDYLRTEARLGGNVRTVDVQVTRLRRKLEPDTKTPRYLVTVRGAGYVLRPDL